MRRLLAALAVVAVAALAVYFQLVRDKTVAAHVRAPRPAATLESGEDAIVVSADGHLVRWLPPPEDPPLPQLPDVELPKGGRLGGPMLEQARVLGAAPAALQPYLARSFYGESGVEVELTTGIGLGFGDDSQAARKWKAAATVLADPSITTLDYVDVQAPTRPAVRGEGHELPPAP